MNLLVWLIKIVHLIIVVGVISSVFINVCYIKQLALTLLIFLMIQYILGYEKCGLTQLEYWILGEDKYQKGFIYRLINPIIKVPENYFYNGLLYLHILWVIILIYQIYHNNCSFLLLG
ncbi:hypothetical protein QJ857_gp1327 [Tupanvirus soda lake]|uniref:DUF2784 family protein n=2 Tax=Tupanvirus TaxID=2094720 RepID=A0A6N1NII2_9VIRU|nr:hypothetical protein QJ857_gp1327 [Tupanvirus soda lake]QKU34735.1 hypothetical protein [Tupanvirus soda lake]